MTSNVEGDGFVYDPHGPLTSSVVDQYGIYIDAVKILQLVTVLKSNQIA